MQDDARPKHVKLVKGRWYWDAPDKLRKSHNLKTISLGGDQTTAWAYARKLNAEHLGMGPDDATVGSVRWMFEAFMADEAFKELAESTQRDYRWLMERVLSKIDLADRPFGDRLAKDVRGRHADYVYALLRQERGNSAAHYACRVARRVWDWGGRRDIVVRADNPWVGMRLKGTPARTQRWSEEQVDAVRLKAIELEAPSIALAVLIGYWWGHRQGDVLGLTWAALDANIVTTVKTQIDVPVDIDAYPELAATLRVERARQTATGGNHKHVVIRESTGERWERHGFGHAFRDVARAAGLPDNLQFRDLRATAVTELVDAGAEAIAASTHTGHKTVGMHRRYARRTTEQFAAAAGLRLKNRKPGTPKELDTETGGERPGKPPGKQGNQSR